MKRILNAFLTGVGAHSIRPLVVNFDSTDFFEQSASAEDRIRAAVWDYKSLESTFNTRYVSLLGPHWLAFRNRDSIVFPGFKRSNS